MSKLRLRILVIDPRLERLRRLRGLGCWAMSSGEAVSDWLARGKQVVAVQRTPRWPPPYQGQGHHGKRCCKAFPYGL